MMGFGYDRSGRRTPSINNPDLQILEDRLTPWDNAEAGLAFPPACRPSRRRSSPFCGRVTCSCTATPLYGGTEFLIDEVLPFFGITAVSFAAGYPGPTIEEALATARARGRVPVVFIETPANPTNGLVDIARCAASIEAVAAAGAGRMLLVVDNTFLGPLWQRPLDHHADIVIYSLTKYVGGHSDLVAGGCLAANALIAPIREMRTILGTTLDPHTGWLLMRSLETLKLRMTCSMKNARHVAELLADHPKVRTVHYLGFLPPGTPQHDIYQRQCRAPGSTFAFEIEGGEAEAFRLLNRLQLIRLAVSLGGTESLMEHPATMTHADVAPEKQREMGITPAMLRISVGIEHPEGVIADLAQALEAV
jgi:methionine-gamma-lyase